MHAYEQLQPVSIDYAVMESAAADGQVVMGSMDVGWTDLGSWTALLGGRRRGRDRAASSSPARRSRSSADDLVVRRAEGAVRVIAAAAGR